MQSAFKKLRWFICGLLLGCGLVYVTQRYHVLRTSSGLVVVPKLTASFKETVVDVRNFGHLEWSQHKKLVAAILRNNQEHLLRNAPGGDDRPLGEETLPTVPHEVPGEPAAE